MTHGGTLHLTAKRAKFKGDVFALHAVGDKDVAGGNSAGHHVGAESLTAFRKLLGKGFVGRNSDSLLVWKPNLSARLAQLCAVDVVLHAVGRDNNIAYGEMLAETSGDARVDQHIGLKEVDHHLCAHSRVDLAHAAFEQHNILVKNLSADKLQPCLVRGNSLLHQSL